MFSLKQIEVHVEMLDVNSKYIVAAVYTCGGFYHPDMKNHHANILIVI